MQSHPLRIQLANEVHARPFQKLNPPLSITHMAVMLEGERMPEMVALMLCMAEEQGMVIEKQVGGFFYAASEQGALRFEPHNEFYSLTLYSFGHSDPPEIETHWFEQLPGDVLCSVEIVFRKKRSDLKGWYLESFGANQVSGSEVMSGAASLWTDFVLRPDTGRVRVLVEDRALLPFQAGRLLQRICEVETYRHMALLALPSATTAMPQVTELDRELADITHRMSGDDQAPAQELLAELTLLAAKVEELAADTANRFGASEAYFAMLDKRIAELREVRVEGYQTVAQFMERRLEPARRTCLAAGARIERLSKRIARVSELIRSQVDLSIEQQNRDLLEALNGRARRQLRMQAKLESFTIIVVTYYAFDLLERTLRNTVQADELRDTALMALSFSVPLIAAVLWWYVRKLIKHYGED